MAIVKDTILVATATLCVGSALMEIPSESKSFNKFFPYIGTFLSAGIGYYFLRRKGYIKAAEYQPSQDMDDYSLNEIAKSSAIEGFEPMKFSVVGNRAEGLETIFDAEGSFGDKPSINLSWKSYEDANEENRDKIALFGYLRDSRVLAMPANDSIKDKINIDFDIEYPQVDMNYTNMDLRGYFDFNGGRFYLIKYDYYTSKFKVKKGQPNFLIKPSYLVLYSKNGINFQMVSGASRRLSKGQLEMVQPLFGDRNSKKAQYQKITTSLNIHHLGFLTGRKQATSEALQYLYFNCLTPELELDFDETLEVASNEFGIEKFQNMIIPYTYKVKDTDKKTRKITNYYYVDEYGDCKFFIAICINEEGTLRFLGDTKGRYGTSKRISNHGVVHSVTEIFEYRPILKYWLKSVVMDSANLSSRRINMWNNDRDKWLKQQYMPMLMSNWLPVLFSRHTSRTALDYIRFMKSCLASSELLKEESPATHQILTDNPNDLDDNVALELFKKYYSSKKNWEELAISWNSKGNDETKMNHTQFYNNITSSATNQLMRNNGDFSYELPITNIYSILDTNDTKNTIVPIASWFRSGFPNVLPLEINNTKDLKVRAIRKLYNKYKIEITDWITLEKMSYYTDDMRFEPSTDNYDPKDMTIADIDPYETLKNMINDPMNWPNNPFVKGTGYGDEMEAETFESKGGYRRKNKYIYHECFECGYKTEPIPLVRAQSRICPKCKKGDGYDVATMIAYEDIEKTMALRKKEMLENFFLKHPDMSEEDKTRYKKKFGAESLEYEFTLYVKEGTEGYGKHGMYNGNTDEIPPNATIEEIVESIVQVAIDGKAIKSFEDIEFLSIENPDEERIYEYDTDSEEGGLKVWFAEGNKKPHSVTISRSSNSEKKLMAVFEDSEGKKIKTTHFGQRGASDYTKHGDKERMQRYLERHGGGTTTSTKEDWKDPTTAGALSRWILWNKPSLSASFSDYKSRFGLKGTLNVSKSAEERKCKSCGKPATTVVQEGSFCYECLPINLGAEYEAKSPAQESLDDWNDEDWKTKSGKPSGETGERFLPTKAIESLTDKEYKETSDKKRKDSKNGKQFSEQPKSIAEKTAKYRASEKNSAYSQFGIDDKISNKEPPMIFIQSYEHDHDGDEMLDNIIYDNYTLISYAIWFKYKVAKTWKGLEGFDIKLIPLTKNSYRIVILMNGKSLYQNKLWKIATNYDYKEWPFNISPQGSSMGEDYDADVYYVGFRFYVEPDTMQAEQYKKIWDAYEQSKTETFEAIEGTGSKARFTDTPDSKVYRDTSLRQKARNSILKGTKGGNAGQWSAIKANLSASKYRTLYENKYGEGKNPYF